MTTEKLYIKKIVDGKEVVFPSAENPVVIGSYTNDRKRMGGASTLTATIYYPYPLDKLWTHEEYVELNGEKYYASSTPSSSKDNSSFMYKHEISFSSEREILDNTLFFDVVTEDAGTQLNDAYRSNMTKFSFGGNIAEFVARINSSLAYCGLYRPKEQDHGYYVVIDDGYGTDEIKEVSFEDMYLTEVLQLINTEYELDYYWVGKVCHVGKVQYDLSTSGNYGDKFVVRYDKDDALLSVSKENNNAKIVDLITGYGSSDNIPYYYPNDDEFGKPIYETENLKGNIEKISLKDLYKWAPSDIYINPFVLHQSKEATANIIKSIIPQDFNISGHDNVKITKTYANNYIVGDVYCRYTDEAFNSHVSYDVIHGQYSQIELTEEGVSSDVTLSFSFEVQGHKKSVLSLKNSNIEASLSYLDGWVNGDKIAWESSSSVEEIKIKSKTADDTRLIKAKNSDIITDFTFLDNDVYIVTFSLVIRYTVKKVAKKYTILLDLFLDAERCFSFSSDLDNGEVLYTYVPQYNTSFKCGNKEIDVEESGITLSNIENENKATTQAVWDEERGWYQEVVSDETDALKIRVTGKEWIFPTGNLMPSIYRKSLGKERFYPALNDTYKIPETENFYTFKNQYKRQTPHQGSVSFDDIKPTINGIRNDVIQEDGLGQLFGEIADVAFDSNDNDVTDDNGNYIHQYFYIKLHKFSGEFGFSLFDHALASEPMVINMIDCQGCPACSFKIKSQPSADNSKQYNCVSTDGNGNLVSVKTEKEDYILDANSSYKDTYNQNSQEKEIWICVQKDNSTLGVVMPNVAGNFKPKKGDKFVITGMNPPKVLTTAAEDRLDKALIKYMSENNDDQFNYSVKLSRIYLAEHPEFASKLNENTKLSLEYDGELHEVFVSNYTEKIDDNVLTEVEVELVNSLEVTQSEIKQMIDSVKGETIRSLTSLSSSSGNSFNANIADKMYLSKIEDDTARGYIKFLKGIGIGDGYEVTQNGDATLRSVTIGDNYGVDSEGNGRLNDAEMRTATLDRAHDPESSVADRTIIGGKGFDLYMGDDGKSHLYVDYLTARMKAYFAELEVRKVSYSGGTVLYSNAGSTIAMVNYMFGEDGETVVAYKCYCVADDGTTKTQNWWKPGMMALSQTFNVKAGTTENASNRYYWRLCIDAGQETLEDGRLYDWVMLSNVAEFKGTDNVVPQNIKQVLGFGATALKWGDVGVAVLSNGGLASFASVCGYDTDDGGTAVASRTFYGYQDGSDVPLPGDVIVQAGDEVKWNTRGNIVKIATSTEDSAVDGAPSIAMFHGMGKPREGGVWQWKDRVSLQSPELWEVTAAIFRFITEEGDTRSLEDLNKYVDEAKTAADKAVADALKAQTDANSAKNDASTALGRANSAINSITEANGRITKVEGRCSTLEQDTEGIRTSVGQLSEKVDDQGTQVEGLSADISTISQKADSISLKVDRMTALSRNKIPMSCFFLRSAMYGTALRRMTLTKDVSYVLSVNGHIDATLKNGGGVLRVYVFKEDWTFDVHVDIDTLENTTKQLSGISVPTTGEYLFMAYAYHEALPQHAKAQEDGTFTLNWAQLEEGKEATPWSLNENDPAIQGNLLPTLDSGKWRMQGDLSEDTENIGGKMMQTFHGKNAVTGDVDVLQIIGQLTLENYASYTLTFYAKGKGTMKSYLYPDAVLYAEDNEGQTTASADGFLQRTLSEDWKRYRITYSTLPLLANMLTNAGFNDADLWTKGWGVTGTATKQTSTNGYYMCAVSKGSNSYAEARQQVGSEMNAGQWYTLTLKTRSTSVVRVYFTGLTFATLDGSGNNVCVDRVMKQWTGGEYVELASSVMLTEHNITFKANSVTEAATLYIRTYGSQVVVCQPMLTASPLRSGFATKEEGQKKNLLLARLAEDSEVWIAGVKLEQSGRVTDYTADGVSVSELLATGIDILNQRIIATTDTFEVRNNKGEVTSRVDADGQLTAGKLATMNRGEGYVKAEDGLLSVFNGSGQCNIRFGYDANSGMMVLSYYDNNGNLLYDLGPSGLTDKGLHRAIVTPYTAERLGAFFNNLGTLGTTTYYSDDVYAEDENGDYIINAKFKSRLVPDASATEGYEPQSALGKWQEIYHYLAAKVSGAYVADPDNGITTADLAREADDRWFYGKPLCEDGDLSLLAFGQYIMQGETLHWGTKKSGLHVLAIYVYSYYTDDDGKRERIEVFTE